MPDQLTITEKLALRMLADEGIAVIWRLHQDSATLYRVGNSVCATTFIEIADAAERECLRQRAYLATDVGG